MNDLGKIAVLGLSLLALCGCGKKPSARDDASQQSVPPGGESTSATLPTAGPAPQDCPSIPDKLAIQRGIQDAMKAIYGVDEAPAKFVVLSVKPADCEHVTVLYRAKTAGAASQSLPMTVGDSGKWFVTLFNKPYPIP